MVKDGNNSHRDTVKFRIDMDSSNMVKTLFSDVMETVTAARYCILIVCILFCFAIFVGWRYPDHFPFLEDQTRALAEQFVGKEGFAFFFKLLTRNLIVLYLTMCLFSAFGIVPVTVALFNGLILGWVIIKATGALDSGIAVLLVPHGIFEVPAMMIGWGIGIWRGLGYRLSTNHASYAERLKKANKVFLTVVFPLLFIASMIEGRHHIVSALSGWGVGWSGRMVGLFQD